MDRNRIEGNWKQLEGKIKEKWGDLTDDDLDKIAGRRDQFEGLIQRRYGLTKDPGRIAQGVLSSRSRIRSRPNTFLTIH
jgi:uncharacterized protein YjbJ (UPF0337 family)